MNKKFVPLTSSQSPSKNPYEIRTYIGEPLQSPRPEWNTEHCFYKRNCVAPPNSTLAKVLTLQDEIRKIHQRTQENIFIKPFSKRCKYLSNHFTTCVKPQRSPEILKQHAIATEQCFKIRDEHHQDVTNMEKLYNSHKSLIELKDPFDDPDDGLELIDVEHGIVTEMASPECSREYIFVPPKKLLGIKTLKSGVFVNETIRPDFLSCDHIPYSTYNPRILQQQFDEQSPSKIDLIPGKNNDDLWTWNVGLQIKELELDNNFIDAAVPSFECNNLELNVYEIPKDIEKTFAAFVLCGTTAVKPQPIGRKKNRYLRPTEIACLYVAFVESYRLNADFWNGTTLDNIIKMGEKLIKRCVQMNYKASKDTDYDIIQEISERKATLRTKVHFAGPLKSEPNIYKALSIYFSKFNVGILCSNKLYLLIWKRCMNEFYVYDPNGRSNKSIRDFEMGVASLLSISYVEHLVHLIVNMSDINLEDEFKLYEISLSSYGKIADPLPKKPFPKSFHKQWAVVNDSYAVIPSCNNGLFQPSSSEINNPSMLISVMAILYSHIQRPKCWKPDQVDELIRIGKAYNKSLRSKLKLTKLTDHINIVDLPDKYVLGTFKASLKKKPFIFSGTVTDFCKSYMNCVMTLNIRELFKNKYEAALLQIDTSFLGIWKDNELFYVYDPFRRGKAGQILDPEDYLNPQGTAILQMHSNIESLLKILYENSMKMRRGGKYFLHAITVGCIKPIMDGKQRKLRYPKLKLTPETYVEPSVATLEQGQGDTTEEQVPENLKSKVKKGKSKIKFFKAKDKNILNKVCSIESLNDKDRQTVIPNYEIVGKLLDQVMCEIVGRLPETEFVRPKLYKSAAKVLLRSDMEYLENLKYLVQHDEDYDNVETCFKEEAKPDTAFISLKDELEMPCNFQSLPDNTWALFGTRVLHHLDEEQLKYRGLLSSIVCAALSAKYKVSTWTGKLIEFVINSVNDFQEHFKSYQYILGVLLHDNLPKLQLGDRKYEVKVQKILRSNIEMSLRQVILGGLVDFRRLLVICQTFSCLIIKRYNFLYMFCGFPVTGVGYRRQAGGPACLMRFIELDSLIRRIEFGCNPNGCDIGSGYVVIPIKVMELPPLQSTRYRNWPKNVEEQILKKELMEKARYDESKKSKMRFLNEELTKESSRIKNFQAAELSKELRRSRDFKASDRNTDGEPRSDFTNVEYENVEDEEFVYEDESETECTVDPKHNFGTSTDAPIYIDKPRAILYGYRMRDQDLLYKIQGSKALDDRTNCTGTEMRPCMFSSVLAILYAIMKPLNEWTSHRIDKIIDAALILNDSTDDKISSEERLIKNISVDDYVFDVWLCYYYFMSAVYENFEKLLNRVLYKNKYILIRTSNCTYAIKKDKYYHLFDSYPSMESMADEEEEPEPEEEFDEDTDEERRNFRKTIKRYRERNTASWILFADLKSLIQYLDKRACSKEWKEKNMYRFYQVQIKSFKKAPPSTFVLQLLTGMQTCNVQDDIEMSVCAHNESIEWLGHCLPIWSRLNRRNAAGRYRGMSVTKLKKYDIEIDNRLWSLWGNLHPRAPVFAASTRGKQHLACCVMALCAATLYRLVDWSSQLLDSIIVNGDRYMAHSMESVQCPDYQFGLENLEVECLLDNVKFDIYVEIVAYGKLYDRPYYNRMNLAEALMYFFNYFQFGILQSFKKCLAIGFLGGNDGGYFMFDCQSHDHPLFPKSQGASYILRTKYLQILLYCIIVTLNIPYYNVQFTLHKVALKAKYKDEDEKKNS